MDKTWRRALAIISITTALLFSMPLLGASVSAAPPGNADKIVAVINDRPITAGEFTAFLDLFGSEPAYQINHPADRQRLLGNFIDRLVLLDAARKEGYFDLPEIKKHAHLSAESKETIVLSRFLRDRVTTVSQPTNAEIAAYQAAHADLTAAAARDRLTSQRQQERFTELMQTLKADYRIKITDDKPTR
jgi:hypothetical protein